MMNALNADFAGEPAMTGAQALDDDMLDAVTGAMDCATGMKLARTYIVLSQIASVMGDQVTAGNLAGRAHGVLDGACT